MPIETTVWECEFCDDQFTTEEDCQHHEHEEHPEEFEEEADA